MDSYTQLNVDDTPLVGHNLSANLSLSPPSPQRKRCRTTLEGLQHTTAKSGELLYFLSLDQHATFQDHQPSLPLHSREEESRTILSHVYCHLYNHCFLHLQYKRYVPINERHSSTIYFCFNAGRPFILSVS
jgi:hypothetical protein